VRCHTFLSLRFMLYPSYLHTSRTVPSTKSLIGADWKENAVFDRPRHAVVLHNEASGGAPAARLDLLRFRKVKECKNKTLRWEARRPAWFKRDVLC
jgi:hypothetical protein